jgi:hypothetical protein
MEVSSKLHAPVALYQGNTLVTHWMWVGESQRRFERCGEDKNLFLLQGIEP